MSYIEDHIREIVRQEIERVKGGLTYMTEKEYCDHTGLSDYQLKILNVPSLPTRPKTYIMEQADEYLQKIAHENK